LFGAQLLLYFEAVARIGAQQAVVLLHVYPMLVVFGERGGRGSCRRSQ
jgi:drug/metabolite transporter (DMT)-like permease